MKTKIFDCVKMKRRGALRIHEETKEMSLAQKIEYWRKKNEAFHIRQKLYKTR